MTSVRHFLLFTVAFLLPLAVQAQDMPPDGRTIEGLQHPESVADAPDGTAFYASNIGEAMAPSEKDGDGFLSRLAPDGSVETLRYLPGPESDVTLHAPKGVVVADGRVFTTDIDRILGFDADSRELVMEVDLADQGAAFLNDVTAMDGQTLFVSGTDQGVIHRVDVEAETATTLDVDIPGVNGLVYAPDEHVLYAVAFGGDAGGQLWTLQLADDGTVSSATSRTIVEGGRFDGVVLQPNDRLLISDWGPTEGDAGPALHLVGRSQEMAETIDLADWQGPADFTCTEGACWIPDLPASTVRVVRPDARLDAE